MNYGKIEPFRPTDNPANPALMNKLNEIIIAINILYQFTHPLAQADFFIKHKSFFENGDTPLL